MIVSTIIKTLMCGAILLGLNSGWNGYKPIVGRPKGLKKSKYQSNDKIDVETKKFLELVLRKGRINKASNNSNVWADSETISKKAGSEINTMM